MGVRVGPKILCVLLIGIAAALWSCETVNAQLPTSDGTCPLPFDFEVDYSDTTFGDVPTACPLNPAELSCFECGCSIAAVTVGNAIAGRYVTEEYLLGEGSTAVNDILACSIQLLPQLEAVNLSLINLLPLIGCTELTEDIAAATACIEGKLRAADDAGLFPPELEMMPDTELEPDMDSPDMEPSMD